MLSTYALTSSEQNTEASPDNKDQLAKLAFPKLSQLWSVDCHDELVLAPAATPPVTTDCVDQQPLSCSPAVLQYTHPYTCGYPRVERGENCCSCPAARRCTAIKLCISADN